MDSKRRENVLRRLSRVEGQVRGLARMVQEDKYCVDILIQVAAAKSALNKIGLIVMEGHAHGCLVDAIKRDEGDKAVDELMDVIQVYKVKRAGMSRNHGVQKSKVKYKGQGEITT